MTYLWDYWDKPKFNWISWFAGRAHFYKTCFYDPNVDEVFRDWFTRGENVLQGSLVQNVLTETDFWDSLKKEAKTQILQHVFKFGVPIRSVPSTPHLWGGD